MASWSVGVSFIEACFIRRKWLIEDQWRLKRHWLCIALMGNMVHSKGRDRIACCFLLGFDMWIVLMFGLWVFGSPTFNFLHSTFCIFGFFIMIRIYFKSVECLENMCKMHFVTGMMFGSMIITNFQWMMG